MDPLGLHTVILVPVCPAEEACRYEHSCPVSVAIVSFIAATSIGGFLGLDHSGVALPALVLEG
jgi:hypothetical protein